ncbi:alanine racemase [Marinicrinis sediminis]|uniref:Alanine racemase n=1 Tax=Marinicrinis sediminis TaxID=1652465 RepID=A0ABW5REM5_9BACL
MEPVMERENDRQQQLLPHSHQAWMEVNLTQLERNVSLIQAHLAHQPLQMAVVKADAYGHGAVVMVRKLAQCGFTYFAVATVEEGIQLRAALSNHTILILGPTPEAQIPEVIEHDLTPTVCTYRFAKELHDYHLEKGEDKPPVSVHIRLDISESSIGINLQTAADFVAEIQSLSTLDIAGVYTHIPSAYGGDLEVAEAEFASFLSTARQLKQVYGWTNCLVHAQSSPGILLFPDLACDMVRTGILLYGLPVLEHASLPGIAPLMEVKARIAYIKTVESDKQFGYGYQYRTDQKVRIASIPIGYNDAMFLYYWQQGQVLIHGQYAPLYGQVYMDYFLVDVTHIPSCQVGDEAVVIGRQGENRIMAEQLAAQCGIDALHADCVHLWGSRLTRTYIEEETGEEEGDTAHAT